MSRGGEQLKVSEVAGLIDQIQAGGGSGDNTDMTKSEHMDLTLNSSSYRVYDPISGGNECLFTLNFQNIEEYMEVYCLFSGIKITQCDKENLKQNGGGTGISSNENINFTVEGTNNAPILIIFAVFNGTGRKEDTICEVVSIPVYCG